MTTLRLDRIAGFAIIVSSGTLLAAIGLEAPAVTSAALFYMLSATLAVSALFLLVELLERIGANGQPQLLDVDAPGEDTNLDDQELPLVGRAFPVSLALVGLTFMSCVLVVAGLPPLSGFIAKLSLLTAVLTSEGSVDATGANVSAAGWIILGLLLVSGFAATVSLARAGIRHLWSRGHRSVPHLKVVEAVAVLALLGSCVGLAVFAEPVLRYTNATAAGLHGPRPYIESVLSTKARPRPAPPTLEQESSP